MVTHHPVTPWSPLDNGDCSIYLNPMTSNSSINSTYEDTCRFDDRGEIHSHGRRYDFICSSDSEAEEEGEEDDDDDDTKPLLPKTYVPPSSRLTTGLKMALHDTWVIWVFCGVVLCILMDIIWGWWVCLRESGNSS